jgi:DNA gyrase subunit A
MTDEAAVRISSLQIVDEMHESYMTYAMSVITARALPDVRDGLKPSQRRVLVAMHDLNLGPQSKYKKCAKIAGDTSGNYHPHGEAVVYPTLVRMAQEFNMRVPLVQGQGNFGSIDGDPPAAMRYTEARLTAAASAMLEDLDKDTVDFVPNYDESRTEPMVLPGTFPNLLVNGSQGIAVGMASSMPPHNPSEICDGLIAFIDNPGIPLKELMKIIPGPDFPTGGVIRGRQSIRRAYKTGRGRLLLRGKAHFEEKKKGRTEIVITEIPFQVNKATLIEKVAELVKDGRIQGIHDINDHSDKDGMSIVISLKKGEDENIILNQLYKFTPLQDTVSIINIALVNGRPRTLPLKSIMEHYVRHRIEVIRRRTAFLLDKAEKRLHIVEGLLIALDHIDAVIETIRSSPDVPTAQINLMERFGLSEVQADAILKMQLQRLTGLERAKLEDEAAKLREEIEHYRAILASERMVLDLIKEDLLKLKGQFKHKRLTEIRSAVETFEKADLIADEEMTVTFSHAGYVKRLPPDTYRRQRRGGKGIIAADSREGDWIERLFIASTHDYLLILTTKGKLHWLKVYEIPQLSRQSKGRAIVNLLRFSQDETIASVVPMRDFSKGDLVMATSSGVIKKTSLSAFSRPMKGGIIAVHLKEGDSLIGAKVANPDDDIMLSTRNGISIRFAGSQVRAMGRTARGVRGISLREGDRVQDMVIARPDRTILTVCENGYGKRTKLDQYRRQSRGGKGIINIRTTKRNGKVVAMKAVRPDDELMLITQKGKLVRIAVKSIPVVGRATQGVRVMALNSEDMLIAITRVVKENNDKGAAAGGKKKTKKAGKAKGKLEVEDADLTVEDADLEAEDDVIEVEVVEDDDMEVEDDDMDTETDPDDDDQEVEDDDKESGR